MTARDEAIIRKARLLLTKRDIEVAALGFRFIEDTDEGYGGFVDGMESTILQAQGWLMMTLSGASPLEGTRYRKMGPPYGALDQDVHSSEYQRFDAGEYEGLNIDDDCAVAELIAACSYAYQFYSADHGGEMLEEEGRTSFAEKFKALGLTKEGCALRIEGIEEIYTRALKGKHDRNETVWC